MTAKKFKFVSPGVFIDEIDNTRRTDIGGDIGPVVIGRMQRGPAMRPVQVESFSEFVELFGEPMPGGEGGDVWRDGNKSAPTYAAYAAQAWLRNNTPLNVVRLLGTQDPKPTSAGYAGWNMGTVASTKTVGTNNGAYGLFLFDSWSSPMASLGVGHSTGSLAAVWYLNDQTSIQLTGTSPFTALQAHTGSAVFINTGSNGSDEFTVLIRNGSALHADVGEKVTFNFNRNSERYIRKVFNTSPTLTNDAISTNAKGYFLGETFDQNRDELFASGLTSEGIILGLASRDDGKEWANHAQATANGSTGWFISQDLGASAQYQPENMQKLFRLKALDGGEWIQNNLKVSIQDIKPSSNQSDPYGSFTVALRKMSDTDNAPRPIEVFSNCSLNPNSPNYVARKIGDQFREWDTTDRRWKRYGKYNNMSRFMYVDMNVDVDLGATDPTYIPVGVFGHKRAVSVTNLSGAWADTHLITSTSNIGSTVSGHGTGGGPKAFLKGGDEDILLASQDGATAASAEDALKITGGTVNNNDAFTVLVPAAAGGLAGDVTITVIAKTSIGGSTPSANQIQWALDGNDANKIANLKLVFNGTSDTSKVKFGSGITDGTTVGIKGLTASDGVTSTESYASLTADNVGTDGNDIAITDTVGTVVVNEAALSSNKLTGGVDRTLWAAFPTGSATTGQYFTASVFFPKVSLRHHGLQGGLSSPRQAYWGADTNQSGTTKFDQSVLDVIGALPGALETSDTTYLEDAWVFTLEDLSGSTTHTSFGAHYISGSRTLGTSITAKNDLSTLLETNRFNRFTTLFAHGFDGLDITEKEPFRNSLLSGKTEANNYAYYTVHRAIDSLKDSEVVEYNLATMPGITNSALTEHLMLTCENRGDALAIIDIEKDHIADSEGTDSETARRGDVDQAVTEMKNRNLNTSYGCAYYPWVQVRDSLSDAILWMPPSVVALGVMSFSEAERALWFAPAGFTRGGLSMGASGLNVIGVRQHLTSQDRDRLYSANVNPIASFPAEGIVIFGQKTLQVTPSALDRINVRRLLIHTKKQVSRIAATTLFEQNVRATWNKFSTQVETFLNDIKAGFGLTDFKVVLDETTTTPEMIDRNILYAKVFLKPARAIEFIALDFIITDTGAAFDD